jgi:hypothetical protein
MQNVIEVTSRKFRDNQKTYFDYADQGMQIIIRRSDDFYILTPLKKNEIQLHLSPELHERIDRGLHEIKTGQTKRYTMDELRQRMDL